MRRYAVALGVYGDRNPGPHAVAMVTRLDGHPPDAWSRVVEGDVTTPRAWLLALTDALRRVDRPRDEVRIFLRDQPLASGLAKDAASDPSDGSYWRANGDLFVPALTTLRARRLTTVAWRGRASADPDMAWAHALALDALRPGGA